MFLPGLLGSPMRAARGRTALTQLLPAEGHCRRFARPPQGEDTPFPKEKKRSGDFSEPLFIFDLPLPADSESRKVKKEPHRAV